MASVQVLIVGAGMAGLSAAVHLVESGVCSVRVFEGSNRVGGRIHNEKFGKGVVHLGANWIHGSTLTNSIFVLANQYKLLETWHTLQRIEGFCYKENGRAIDDDIKKEVYKLIDDVEEEEEYKRFKSYDAFLDHYISEYLKEFDEEDRVDAKSVFNSMKTYMNFHCGCDLGDLAVEDKYESIPGEQIKVPGEGMSLIPELLSMELPPDTIQFGKEVTQITWHDENEKRAKVFCADGSYIHADHVIVTSSLGYLKANHESLFSPALPSCKSAAIKSLGYGTVNKIIMEYAKPFWYPGQGGVTFAWTDKEVKLRSPEEWYKKIFAFDEVLENPNVLLGWIGSSSAKYMENLSDEEISETCTNLLRRFLDNPSIPKPVNIRVTSWSKDHFAKGSYSYNTVNTPSSAYHNLRHPLFKGDNPVVMFAGEATHENWYSTMHGARSTGLREAERLKAYLKTRGDQ